MQSRFFSNGIPGAGLRFICRNRLIDEAAQATDGGQSTMGCYEPAAVQQVELRVQRGEAIAMPRIFDEQADDAILVMDRGGGDGM